MAHYLVHRQVIAPGLIELACSCGWTVTDSPSMVQQAWDSHYDQYDPTPRCSCGKRLLR